jgi:hypothetical protein
MTQADVTNQPLLVNFSFYPFWVTSGFTDNGQYGSPTTLTLQQLEGLDAALTTQLSALTPLLTDSLGQDFNTPWQQVKAQTIQTVTQQIESQASADGHSISDVILLAPDAGNVIAVIDPPANGSTIAELGLSYQLTGWQLTFNAVTPGANWKDTFDVTLSLNTPVPELPFGFAPTLTMQGSNSNFGPNDWEASFDEGVDNIFTDIGNAFTDGTYESDYSYVQKAIENSTDAAQSFTIQNPLVNALNQLNSQASQVVANGFNKFVVSITNGNQLTATLSHPLDPGPEVEDQTAPTGGIDLLLTALSASDSVVAPGGTLTVAGTQFPLPNSTQLYLQWPNTVTGTVKADWASELVITGGGHSATPITVKPATGPVEVGMTYDYTATGLKPGVEYSFVARNRDTVAWSQWSKTPLKLTTGASDTVQIVLQGPSGSTFKPVTLGTVTLSANGQFSSHVTIPTATPPGSYVLAADLNGKTLATVNLTVGAATAHVDLIDANNQVINDAIVTFESSFKVRGEAFPNSQVTIAIDGKQVAQVTPTNGEFIETLKSPPATIGNLTLTATGGGQTASVLYQQVGQLT